MQIISDTTEFECKGSTAVAIGKFDGVHRGHRKLLDQILKAKEDGLMAAVFTFDPPPSVFFTGRPQAELTTREEKRRIFEALGVDVLIEFPLNAQTAAIAPEDFVARFLCGQMHTRFLAAGTDLSFGDQGKGDWRLLRAMADRMGYQVQVIDKLLYEGREISSTFVREAVAAGKMELAAGLLGAPYSVGGPVMHGRKLGRTLGMPTVNLLPPPDKLLPPRGVYMTRLSFEGVDFSGITNVGCRPTVSSSGQMSVETYVYDFHEEIYGEPVEVSFYSFCRPELRFDGVEQLKENMAADIRAGREYWTRQDGGRELICAEDKPEA